MSGYVQGEFRTATGTAWTRQNPADLSKPVLEWQDNSEFVEKALTSAVSAFHIWKKTPVARRIEFLKGLQNEIQKRAQGLENALVDEGGKIRAEAKAEVQGVLAKIKITLETAKPLFDTIEKTLSKPAGTVMKFMPRGVCLVLGPFNFPVHLPNGHIIPALLAGNVVIFKPSEFGVRCAQIYSECFHVAGFPAGTYQMLPGGPELGQKLVEDPRVKSVLFTGSSAVGHKITESIFKTRPDLSTLAALEMGGKNAMIVHEDAQIDRALAECVIGAYSSAGQRCASTSRVFVHKEIFGFFRERLQKIVEKIPYGSPEDPKVFYGPLIHPEAVEKFLGMTKTLRAQGFKILVESVRKESTNCFVSPCLAESVDPKIDVKKSSLKDEFFGPHAILIPYGTENDLIEYHEACPYGLVTSVFTKDRSFYERLGENLSVGLLNLNRSTVGASSALPFGGTKKSGNNWPAGIFSYFYCVTPQARLEENTAFDPNKLPEGLKGLL